MHSTRNNNVTAGLRTLSATYHEAPFAVSSGPGYRNPIKEGAVALLDVRINKTLILIHDSVLS